MSRYLFKQDPVLTINDGLFAPFEVLLLLSTKQYTTLIHPFFSNYGIRIKNFAIPPSTSTTEEGAKDVANFIAIFFEHFHQFKGRTFYMAGESYGMRNAHKYLPVYASESYDRNMRLVEAGLIPINLQSIIIGDGLTDTFTQIFSSYNFGCESTAVHSFLSIKKCIQMKTLLSRCQKWIRKSCVDIFDKTDCTFARVFYLNELLGFYLQSGTNPYDIRKECVGKIEETSCYPEYNSESYTGYIDTEARHPFFYFFGSRNDPSKDDAIPWINSEIYDHTRLVEAGLTPINLQSVMIGLRNLSGNGLTGTFAQIFSNYNFGCESTAVHPFLSIEVPYDRPKESLALVQCWLAQQNF
ncbi:hypothetical protein AN958_07785 [Leucoagaricus sp. SymC.cos]|nr:hypothetical protein AN958_07785 [Leucoagaricus sp. SymC.cos]